MEQDAVLPVRNSRIAEALGAWASPGVGGGAAMPPGGGPRGAGAIAAAFAAAGDGAAVRGAGAAALISTRQFKPFDDARSGSRPTAELDGGLLSADEKIAELSRIVDKVRQGARHAAAARLRRHLTRPQPPFPSAGPL